MAIGVTGTGAFPVTETVDRLQTQNLSQNSSGQQQQSTIDQAANQYRPGQISLQDQLGTAYSSLIQGQLPQQFGISDATRAKYWRDWNDQVAPLMTARHGAGSPAVDAAARKMALDLAALDSEKAFGQASSAFQAATNMAFNSIGRDQTGQATKTATEDLNRNTTELTHQQTIGMDLGALWQFLNPLPPIAPPGTGASAPTGAGTAPPGAPQPPALPVTDPGAALPAGANTGGADTPANPFEQAARDAGIDFGGLIPGTAYPAGAVQNNNLNLGPVVPVQDPGPPAPPPTVDIPPAPQQVSSGIIGDNNDVSQNVDQSNNVAGSANIIGDGNTQVNSSGAINAALEQAIANTGTVHGNIIYNQLPSEWFQWSPQPQQPQPQQQPETYWLTSTADPAIQYLRYKNPEDGKWYQDASGQRVSRPNPEYGGKPIQLQPSTNGGYYDASGQISGTLTAAQAALYDPNIAAQLQAQQQAQMQAQAQAYMPISGLDPRVGSGLAAIGMDVAGYLLGQGSDVYLGPANGTPSTPYYTTEVSGQILPGGF